MNKIGRIGGDNVFLAGWIKVLLSVLISDKLDGDSGGGRRLISSCRATVADTVAFVKNKKKKYKNKKLTFLVTYYGKVNAS